MSGSGGGSGGVSSHAYDAQHPMWSQIHTIHFEPRPDACDKANEELSETRRLVFLDYQMSFSSACSIDCSQDIAGAAALPLSLDSRAFSFVFRRSLSVTNHTQDFPIIFLDTTVC
jgi:hypothetical protein